MWPLSAVVLYIQVKIVKPVNKLKATQGNLKMWPLSAVVLYIQIKIVKPVNKQKATQGHLKMWTFISSCPLYTG
jgi:hypothetical protein